MTRSSKLVKVPGSLAILPAPDFAAERFQLSCGAQLVVSPRPGAPVCAVQLHLRGSQASEPADAAGLAFLCGALLDQGTASRSEEEIAQALEPAGGSLLGDATGLSGTIESSSWELLLDLLCELATRPAFPSAEVERQKARLVERLRVDAEDPRVQSAQLFRQLVYGEHWLARPTQGTAESVERIQRADLAAFHASQWCARRALIAVCGDVRPKDARDLLDDRLAHWNPGTEAPAAEGSFPALAERRAARRIERQQVHVDLGHLGVRRSDSDYEALVVMDHVLGAGPGFTNRIARSLRDEQGLAYAVGANIHGSAGLLPGTFAAYIGTSPENVGRAIEGLLREIRRIRDEPVGRQELETAKSYLIGSNALGFERAARRVSYLIAAERFGLPDDYLRRFPAAIAAVGVGDVQRAARTHLHPDLACIAAAGPLDQAALARHSAGARSRARVRARPARRTRSET